MSDNLQFCKCKQQRAQARPKVHVHSPQISCSQMATHRVPVISYSVQRANGDGNCQQVGSGRGKLLWTRLIQYQVIIPPYDSLP